MIIHLLCRSKCESSPRVRKLRIGMATGSIYVEGKKPESFSLMATPLEYVRYCKAKRMEINQKSISKFIQIRMEKDHGFILSSISPKDMAHLMNMIDDAWTE